MLSCSSGDPGIDNYVIAPTMSSPIALALAPARQGRLLPRNRQKPRPNEDALVLFPPGDGAEAAWPAGNDDESRAPPQHGGASQGRDLPRCSAGIGRRELRLAHWQVCPCRARPPPPPTNVKDGFYQGHHRQRQSGASQASSFCHRCQFPWTRHLKRTFLRLQDDGGGARAGPAGLWVQAPHAGDYPILDRMCINGRCLREYGLHPTSMTTLPPWLGPFPVQAGDSISLEPPTSSGVDEGDSQYWKELEFQVVAQRNGRWEPMPALYSYTPEPLGPGAPSSLMKTTPLARSTADTESPLETQILEQKQSLGCHDTLQEEQSPPKCVETLRHSRSLHETESSTDASANSTYDTKNYLSLSPANKDVTMAGNALAGRCNTLRQPKHLVHHLQTYINDGRTSNPRLYFVKCNRYWDMHNKSIRERAIERALTRGGSVLDKFERQNLPTHLIVDRNFRMEDAELLKEDLKFQNVQEMQHFLRAHDIIIARLNWVMKDANTPFGTVLHQDEMYHLPTQDGALHKRQIEDSMRWLPKRVKHDCIDSQSEEPINGELIRVFTELSHVYRESPVDEQDAWRAFTFSRAASVIRNLDFSVTSETLQELRKLKGLKDSCINIVQEYLQTRRCKRLEMLRTDEYRVSLRAFTGIWSVGPKKAKELVSMGYRNIAELRKATESGKLKWLRNEYLGLKYYDDINEEMSRGEAKMIVDVVTSAALNNQLCPTASVAVQGSYRRGKDTCGDVDLIITDSSWEDEVPPTFLGRLADKLREDGFVVHHLTMIRGMSPGTFETLDVSEWEYIRPSVNVAVSERSEKLKDKRSYTWFGICRSPMYPNKVRRVDIKCYPYADHIYAWLYFTGNGHFNRAMRFWSKKQKEEPRYHLDDHGLWELNATGKLFVDEYGHQKRASTKNGGIFVPQTERDVFDFLNLAWKEPHERDGFGALHTKDDGKVCDIPMTFVDILTDNKEHCWVD